MHSLLDNLNPANMKSRCKKNQYIHTIIYVVGTFLQMSEIGVMFLNRCLLNAILVIRIYFWLFIAYYLL